MTWLSESVAVVGEEDQGAVAEVERRRGDAVGHARVLHAHAVRQGGGAVAGAQEGVAVVVLRHGGAGGGGWLSSAVVVVPSSWDGYGASDHLPVDCEEGGDLNDIALSSTP